MSDKLRAAKVRDYKRARADYLRSIGRLSAAEAALFLVGSWVEWKHGDSIRSGQVVRYIHGILGEGRVTVLSRANKEQQVDCARILVDEMV